MSVSEYQRHQLFQWFEESMGPERAATMMEVLPTVDWTQVATKSDLRGEMGELRGEMGELRGEMGELRGEIKNDIAQATRLIFFGMLASQATLVGLVFATARLA